MLEKQKDNPSTNNSSTLGRLGGAELKRYNRHIILPEIGLEGQQKLKLAKVLVIGAGGLGCPLLQYLAAAGVGTISIIDSDKIDESNLHRQILYSSNDVGKNKADIAAKKLSELNPFIKIIPIVSYLNSENALQLFSDFDIIIDGSDNFATRYLVNDACVILNKPFVSGSIYKFQGQISVFNYHDGPTYRCLYPEPGEIPNCAEIGVLGVLPGIVGCLMANETIKMIIGNGEVLSGKLLVFDSLTMQFNTFEFSSVAENKTIKTLGNYDFFCDTKVKEITADELKNKILLSEKFQLIDVRELHEYEIKNIGGVLIPLNELENNLDKISTTLPLIIHCQSGMRSKKAIELLKQKGFNNLTNLKNGLMDF